MPVVLPPGYRSPWWGRNPWIQLLWSTFLRRVSDGPWVRERLELSDGDFLDLDWWRSGARRCLVISHGLEGHSRRPYATALARAASRRGWEVVSWNMRGCSGEPNRLMRCYHSGASDDLAAVVDHVARTLPGLPIALAGFSLGGNVTLKFLGEDWPVLAEVRAGLGISVPCDLRSAALRIADAGFGWPMRWFLRDLGPKMEAKQARFGGAFPTADWRRMRSFAEFDDAFTAPIHGFRSAEDYWAQCSSLRFLPAIRVPSLLLNALDDPMLSPGCFPFELARDHPYLHLEAPRHGGHVAFASAPDAFGDCWSETRSLDFLDACVPV
ncbi:MAG: hypothetical protein RLZ45_778 [Verrucomicrobiota bacterium]|jgi:predicted alpha/beta-fold hydrolase